MDDNGEGMLAPADAVPDGLGLRMLRAVLDAHQRLLAWAVPGPSIWDVERFPGLVHLEAGWRSVREEYDALEADRVRHDFEEVAGMPLGVVGDWQAHFLFDQGRVLPVMGARCPATIELLAPIEGLRSAYFSIMGPGTHLLPHAGPNRSILRGHLTLRTPAPRGAAALEVDGRRIEHEAGVAFVFDDTFVHEAWNEGGSDRVTLMLDLRRPLPAWLRPIDAVVQALWQMHPVRRRAGRRLAELDAARNG